MLPLSDLLVVTFDPYMFDRHGSGRKPGNMDPTDLDRLINALDHSHAAVVLQISTYSANNDNAQPAVREVIVSRLQQADFREVALVRANGNMMSLVFARGIKTTDLGALSVRFNDWLDSFRQ